MPLVLVARVDGHRDVKVRMGRQREVRENGIAAGRQDEKSDTILRTAIRPGVKQGEPALVAGT